MAILTDLKDPRIQHVTVTSVEVTPDMRQATVKVSVMGDETKQRLSLHGLRSAAGFLQSKVGNRIDTRYTPRLQFELDLGVKKSIEIAEILRRVLPSEPPAKQADDPEDGEEGQIEALAEGPEEDSAESQPEDTSQPD